MRILFLSILIFFCTASVQAQNPLVPVLKTYFRTHPFDIRFSSFITSLQEDPWFTTQYFDRRTDTSFFYMSGTYKNFNPFHFNAKEVRLTIAEDNFKHFDSLQTLDTLINIQMMGITDTILTNESLVKKEYTGFLKKYSKLFWKSNTDKNNENDLLKWELTNLFIYPYSISPISVAWGRIHETREYVFTITIRIKVKYNVAEFVLPKDGL